MNIGKHILKFISKFEGTRRSKSVVKNKVEGLNSTRYKDVTGSANCVTGTRIINRTMEQNKRINKHTQSCMDS